jgi:coenzyme F420 hydrogenase subunit beta
VCPGHSVELQRLSSSLFNNTEEVLNIGRFVKCYTGHSLDYNIRYHAASGGVVSSLLIFMLENKLIESAIVTRMSKGNPLEPEVIIAKTRQKILEGKSSKYCPVPLNLALTQIMSSSSGKFAIVGLPCHIHGLRKAEIHFPVLKNKIFYLGLYCSSTRTFGATEFLLQKYGILKNDINSFAYRDERCLGNMLIRLKKNIVKKYEYLNYYPPIRSFFIPHRCTLCIDHTAELADISFGDIHIPEYWDDKIGTTSIIVRSEKGNQVLANAYEKKYISLEPVDKKLIIKSQQSSLKRKKCQIFVRFKLLRMLGMKYPVYDNSAYHTKSLQEYLKHFISALILYAEMAIGKRRYLWFTIKILHLSASKLKKK